MRFVVVMCIFEKYLIFELTRIYLHIMIKRKLLLVFVILFVLSGIQTIKAQTPNIAIALNEYCVSNTTGPADNYGQLSDWVEIYNAHTSSVSLAGYYLSNDRFNLKKWQFPNNYTIPFKGYAVVWLSGKNNNLNGNLHTNFTVDQSKDQWLIISTAQGAIRDSVFVQRTKAGHTRGRVDYNNIGVQAWKLYTSNSQGFANPTINNFKGYVQTPKLFSTLITNTSTYSISPNQGGFFDGGSMMLFVRLGNSTYDTTYFPCQNVYYTLNGNYPIPNAPGTIRYFDSLTPINIDKTTIVRIIATPNDANPLLCEESVGMLNSFCETNTYFTEPAHQTFTEDFGVVSLAIDRVDSAWFISQGNPPSTTVHVEYYDKKKQISEGYAIINRPINEEWVNSQKGFYVSIDDRYGSGASFEGQVFNVEGLGASSRTVFPTLHLKGGGIESHSPPLGPATSTSYGTAIRDVFVQSLAAKYNLNVSPLHIKPVITFINGLYFGVNDLREVYDKYYENFYYGQPLTNMDLNFYHNGDGTVTYPDGDVSQTNSKNTFRTAVFDKVIKFGLGNGAPTYSQVMTQLDKTSYMDYMILNNFTMNSSLWNYNVALAKGGDASKPGGKWHYYLWNMPTVFNFTSVATNTLTFKLPDLSPCYYETTSASMSNFISPRAFNGHGLMFYRFMHPNTGNPSFKLEYKNRYQDLLNTALKCENIAKHFDYIYKLYATEMKCHEDPACIVGTNPFNTSMDLWDTNMVKFRKTLDERCYFVANSFTNQNCYGVTGPHPLTVDVEPAGAGTVKLNTILLDSYPWRGDYFATLLSFKAISTNTTQYRFHHWKLRHTAADPVSRDSIGVYTSGPDDVVAVFTDITKDINNSDYVNIPNGFSPNGDGLNDAFRPLGSAEFVTEYQISIWNRWGQEMYRSTDPLSSGWDGNFNGQPAITGVYAYVVTYKNVYGESKVLKGNITLTR